jgi:hypothetical protein
MEQNIASAVQAHTEIAARASAMRSSIDDIYLNALLKVLSTLRDDVEFHQELVHQSRSLCHWVKSELMALTHGGHGYRRAVGSRERTGAGRGRAGRARSLRGRSFKPGLLRQTKSVAEVIAGSVGWQD